MRQNPGGGGRPGVDRMMTDRDAGGGVWGDLESIPLEARLGFEHALAMLVDAAERHGEAPALSFQLEATARAPSVTWSYRRYAAEVIRAANLFRSLGVRPGDGIGLLLPNLPQTAVALVAATAAGVAVPINPLLAPEQIAGILRDARVRVLVTLAPFPKTDLADKAAAALALAPAVRHLLEIDLLPFLRPPRSWLAALLRPRRKPGHRAERADFDRARAQHAGDRLAFDDLPDRDSVAACFHTGGTTGIPKLARHTHRNLLFMGWVTRELLYRPGDVALCGLPLFHVFAAYITGFAAISGGVHTVLLCPAGFRSPGIFDQFWKLAERWRGNFLLAVPTVFAMLLQRPVDGDVSSIRYAVSGAAALPRELLQEFEAKTGMRILEGYGQTESTCVISCNPPEGERRPGSVGIALPYCEVRALRQADPVEFCATGEVGELVVRGPNVFAGYVRAALNTDLFLAGGWLRTGDLGSVDAAGYIWITGRSKDIIIRSGHNIDPAEIEAALASHPAVAFAAAVGRPDPVAGELPFAFVELRQGASAPEAELRDHAAGGVGDPVARPQAVRILPELPKTAVGKVYKPELRKILIRESVHAALAEAGIEAGCEVVDDAEQGLVVVIRGGGDDAVGRTVGSLGLPWRRPEPGQAAAPAR